LGKGLVDVWAHGENGDVLLERTRMDIPSQETRRLNLRPFRDMDAPALHRILSQDEMLKYFPWPAGPSMEKVERFVRSQVEQWSTVGYAWWAVELKSSGRLIGWNGLQYLPETRETEIGYLIDRALWGQGLATEGARVGLSFGFAKLRLETIIALAHPDNVASRRVMEKLGMRFGGMAQYFGADMARYTIDAPSYAARVRGNQP
jgi:RimJ/RimL family protein N-acetyltransferase